MNVPKNLKEILQITVRSNVISSYVISIGEKQFYDLPTSEYSKYIFPVREYYINMANTLACYYNFNIY